MCFLIFMWNIRDDKVEGESDNDGNLLEIQLKTLFFWKMREFFKRREETPQWGHKVTIEKKFFGE